MEKIFFELYHKSAQCSWPLFWNWLGYPCERCKRNVRLHLLFLWQSSVFFISSHVASYSLCSFQGRICPHGCLFHSAFILWAFFLFVCLLSLLKDLPLSLKHMDGFDMLFTCHWHDDHFENCCVSRSVHIHVIARVSIYLANVFFVYPTLQPTQSWYALLQSIQCWLHPTWAMVIPMDTVIGKKTGLGCLFFFRSMLFPQSSSARLLWNVHARENVCLCWSACVLVLYNIIPTDCITIIWICYT